MTPTILLATGIVIARRVPVVRRIPAIAGARLGGLAPNFFALITFVAGAILLFSGATPARAGRVGWLNDFLPLPVVEASAYFASIAGIGLIVLARGLQRRLDAAYHLTLWLLAGGVVFAVTSALDIEQAIVLSIMLVMLLPNRRFFYRKSSIWEERFTPGWIVAISVVLVGTVALVIAGYGRTSVGAEVFWRFSGTAQGPRELRALTSAAIVLVSVASARLIRPARTHALLASAEERASAEAIVAASTRASAQLAFLGDKTFMFNADRSAFIMYGVSGQSWVSVGDPVGANCASVKPLIDDFITRCDRSGGWPVFYRVRPALLHLYLDYALTVVKLGEVARVSLPDFSLDGPRRRNLRRVWRKAIDDGCTFEIARPDDIDGLLPTLREISDAWLREKRTREKGFSLGAFDEDFVRRSAIGIVRQRGKAVAFVTLWRSGEHAEVEVDLMRYGADAPPGIMRYALIEAMFWAKAQGYQQFNLGMAPLSGIRASSVTPIWNQLSLAVRGGEV